MNGRADALPEELGIGPADEVLCPSLTFVATAAAVIHCGATPVLVDICSLQDPTMDPVDAKQVTSRNKALLPVYSPGSPRYARPLSGWPTRASKHR